VLLTLLGAACSSSDADADAELVSAARFPDRFADVWCQSVAPCCAAQQIAYEPATCQSQARDFAASLLGARVQGDTRYSAAAGTLCLTRLERTLHGCELEEASTACALIFVGSAAEGTPCSNGSACASGYCALGEAALSGVCAKAEYRAPSHGQLGEPCVGSCGVPGSFQCPSSLLPTSEGTTNYCYAEDGLHCSFDSESLDALSCQPYAAVGAACDAANVSCSPGSFCAEGQCVAQQAAGPCTDTPDVCDASSYCDANQQCQPRKPIGARCSSGEECSSLSCDADAQAVGVCDSGNKLAQRACAGLL
ncbi:MAG TPA: hypothetical protein VGJ91_08935, partial [Polyangiaceae bacterium]|jgi:hypothetical protein